MLNAAVPAIPCRIVAAAAIPEYYLPVMRTKDRHEKFAQMVQGKRFRRGGNR
jgi:hypothetical protein